MAFVLTNGQCYIAIKKNGGIIKSPRIEEAQRYSNVYSANRKLQRAPGKCRGYYILKISNGKKRRKYSTDVRKMIYNKAGGRCALCGHKILFEDMTLDHIIPLAMNGPDEVENLSCTCKTCNQFKGHILPDDFMERIIEIFMYQMERKYTNRMKWKIVHRLLEKMV